MGAFYRGAFTASWEFEMAENILSRGEQKAQKELRLVLCESDDM